MSRSPLEYRRPCSKELQAIAHALNATDSASVLATLVRVEGSSYRRPGARLLVLSNGTRIGSISGGCLEEDLLTRAAKVAATGQAEAVTYDTTSENDVVWGVGLGCHGIVRILLERLPPRPTWARVLTENFAARHRTRLAVVHAAGNSQPLGTIAVPDAGAVPPDVFAEDVGPPLHLGVFGAGDDARPLVRLAKELGWRVTVADPRPAFATTERFPEADHFVVGAADTLAPGAALDADSLAVVMTHHYVHDVPVLRSLLPQPLRYLGLLGPKKRSEKILADLAKEGVAATDEERLRLHAPVGLDLGADTPEQVALAIVAEALAVLANRNARPLRERTTPIHDVLASAAIASQNGRAR